MIKNYNEIINVSLVGCTAPVEEIDVSDVQELIAYCAKVSNPQFQTDFSKSDKLLKYLIAHKHWSPFELASVTMEITTTRDIARQILRHRSFSFQEFSQRYKEIDALDDSFATKEARFQHPTNRQDSIDLNLDDLSQRDIAEEWRIKQENVIATCKQAYDWALANGLAKEVARSVLPEGNTISKMYMQGTIRSWIHYIELRSANGTQKEHMLIAIECAKAINKIFKFISQ